MLGFLVKIFAILLALGLGYVTIKRALVGKGKPAEPKVAPTAAGKPEGIAAEDLERCPSCGTYNPAGQACSRAECSSHNR